MTLKEAKLTLKMSLTSESDELRIFAKTVLNLNQKQMIIDAAKILQAIYAFQANYVEMF